MIWLEAIDQLLNGGALRHRSLELCPEEDGGYLLREADGREEGHTILVDALEAFLTRVGERGLRQAVTETRYQRLFPRGSSLSWAQIPLGVWTPGTPLPDLSDLSDLQRRWPQPQGPQQEALRRRTLGGCLQRAWEDRDSARAGSVADELHGEAPRTARR